ncbi:GNAT family N-acetyltransferase [uncultured Gemella sp.]|uniref:GNAT family N-acetyltransferase n=1 Tax=uncultured Gemella sp. TaxID=254352 RepID=UPI0028D8D505|nr:GNAT family N-acetyltransferase [uncultured Gemella sp.]
MFKLKKINRNNIGEILKLEVFDNQKSFVATNNISIIEAYIAITENNDVFTFGIYKEDTPIGFLMIGFDVNSDDEGAPKIAKGNYNIWRLMIDKKFQGEGYGKKAMDLALEFINTFPSGTAKYCWLSYESDNNVARELYKSVGFVETDEKDGEEIVAILELY